MYISITKGRVNSWETIILSSTPFFARYYINKLLSPFISFYFMTVKKERIFPEFMNLKDMLMGLLQHGLGDFLGIRDESCFFCHGLRKIEENERTKINMFSLKASQWCWQGASLSLTFYNGGSEEEIWLLHIFSFISVSTCRNPTCLTSDLRVWAGAMPCHWTRSMKIQEKCLEMQNVLFISLPPSNSLMSPLLF